MSLEIKGIDSIVSYITSLVPGGREISERRAYIAEPFEKLGDKISLTEPQVNDIIAKVIERSSAEGEAKMADIMLGVMNAEQNHPHFDRHLRQHVKECFEGLNGAAGHDALVTWREPENSSARLGTLKEDTSFPPHSANTPHPPAAPSGVSFLQQYFIPPEETSWASVARNFREADTKRFGLKVGAVALGGIALADGCWLAAHKDDNNNRHPLKGLCIGAAGALGLVAGLMMRGTPLSR